MAEELTVVKFRPNSYPVMRSNPTRFLGNTGARFSLARGGGRALARAGDGAQRGQDVLEDRVLDGTGFRSARVVAAGPVVFPLWPLVKVRQLRQDDLLADPPVGEDAGGRDRYRPGLEACDLLGER